MVKSGISSIAIGILLVYCEKYLFLGVMIANEAEAIVAYTIAIIGLGLVAINFIITGILLLWRKEQ
jgi:hypothetical protein